MTGLNAATMDPSPMVLAFEADQGHRQGVGSRKRAWLFRGFGVATILLMGISACAVLPSESHTASPSASALAFNPVVLGTRMVQPITVNKGSFLNKGRLQQNYVLHPKSTRGIKTVPYALQRKSVPQALQMKYVDRSKDDQHLKHVGWSQRLESSTESVPSAATSIADSVALGSESESSAEDMSAQQFSSYSGSNASLGWLQIFALGLGGVSAAGLAARASQRRGRQVSLSNVSASEVTAVTAAPETSAATETTAEASTFPAPTTRRPEPARIEQTQNYREATACPSASRRS